MVIGACTLDLYLPGVTSLKEKRGVLKSLMARLHREFNVSCAEVDHQDVWQSARLGVVIVSNDGAHVQRALDGVVRWVERNRPDVTIVDYNVEVIH
jgi:uncharacterized protein YlxP (DUF503 family)